MSLKSFLERLPGKRNIALPKWKPKLWDTAHVDTSLTEMFTYAEENAKAAIDWYYDKKGGKAFASRICRLGTILLTAAAALIPILGSTGWFCPSGAEQAVWTLKLNQAGYLALGLAALFLALDKFLAGSTSWMRYISTAAAIQTAQMQFHCDWDKLMASLGGRTPAGAELTALINRITEFSVTVRAQVENETKAWVAEFQANLAELQTRTAAAVDAARAQVQTAQQEADKAQQAARPGGIDLTVENAAEADAGYEVLVDGRSEKTGVAGVTCGILGISPGPHDLEVRAKIGGAPAHASQLVTVPAGAGVKAQLKLAKPKAAAAP